jgi:hypothetical protein
MFKLPLYVVFLIGAIVVPVLSKVCEGLKEQAKKTPETWDDVAVGAFETVLEFLRQPGLFEPKTK